jgi:hypothetical protein
MRKLREAGILSVLSSEVFAVLQSRAINEPLFPNLKSLDLWTAVGGFAPFILLFLSSRTTSISITFAGYALPKVVFVASMVTTFPTSCPNLQAIYLRSLPRDPIITAAVSEFLLTTNRDALRQFHVDSPLTEEAREVIYKHLDLCGLTVVIEGPTSLPTMVLPNLTDIIVEYDHNRDWLEGFRGATLGKLDSVTFRAKSESAQISNFLEAVESVGLTTSTALSTFILYTHRPWRPNYYTLLSFKQLRELEIWFSCDGGCSSTIDDDIITDMARAMPKLETLRLGDEPCQTPTGVTAKGLTVLAYYCPNLSSLIIHFRVDSFNALPTNAGIPHTGTAAQRRDCTLTNLDVGEIRMPEESTLAVALTLARIFPYISWIGYIDNNWEKVLDAICLSRQIVDHTSKEHTCAASRSDLNDILLRSYARERQLVEKLSGVTVPLISRSPMSNRSCIFLVA